MIIKVTQDHIDGATYDSSPIELACQSVWPNATIDNCFGNLRLDGSPVEIPYLVDMWIRHYYDGSKVHPFEFWLEVPWWLRIKLWFNNPR